LWQFPWQDVVQLLGVAEDPPALCGDSVEGFLEARRNVFRASARRSVTMLILIVWSMSEMTDGPCTPINCTCPVKIP